MKWLPDSLLGRISLAIALAVITSHLILSSAVRRYLDSQRLRHDADLIEAHVRTVRTAISALPADDRARVITHLVQSGTLSKTPAPGSTNTLPESTDWLSQLTQLLRRELGAETMVLTTPGLDGSLSVLARVDGHLLWMIIPWHRLPTPWLPNEILLLIGLAGILSFIGGYAIVLRINRPISSLMQAAQAVGRGEFPPPVIEDGAIEIRTLSRNFNHMVEALGRLDADRNLLLAGVSHDLRTPLTRIRLRAEMLEEADLKRTREGMIRDIEFMDGIVNQFLDFARAQQSEKIELTDLNSLVQGVVERYQVAGATIELKLGAIPLAEVRPMAIRRLMTNLVDNAVRYGGKTIQVTTEKQEDHFVVRVLDRGPGVAQEHLARLTEPFFRPDPARGQGGTGLGLAIVARIAQLHEGKFELQPRPGGGLEARLTLPA